MVGMLPPVAIGVFLQDSPKSSPLKQVRSRQGQAIWPIKSKL